MSLGVQGSSDNTNILLLSWTLASGFAFTSTRRKRVKSSGKSTNTKSSELSCVEVLMKLVSECEWTFEWNFKTKFKIECSYNISAHVFFYCSLTCKRLLHHEVAAEVNIRSNMRQQTIFKHKVLQLIPHFKQALHCFLPHSPTGPKSQWNIFVVELRHCPLLLKSARILITSHSFTDEWFMLSR